MTTDPTVVVVRLPVLTVRTSVFTDMFSSVAFGCGRRIDIIRFVHFRIFGAVESQVLTTDLLRLGIHFTSGICAIFAILKQRVQSKKSITLACTIALLALSTCVRNTM